MMLEMIRIRRLIYIEKLIYGALTPTQKLEKQTRVSIDGRTRAYCMAYWSPRRAREAVLALFAHGAWSVPVSAATDVGFWEVQLPDN